MNFRESDILITDGGYLVSAADTLIRSDLCVCTIRAANGSDFFIAIQYSNDGCAKDYWVRSRKHGLPFTSVDILKITNFANAFKNGDLNNPHPLKKEPEKKLLDITKPVRNKKGQRCAYLYTIEYYGMIFLCPSHEDEEKYIKRLFRLNGEYPTVPRELDLENFDEDEDV